MPDLIKAKITNPSASGLHYAAKGGYQLFIPGNLFEPEVCEIPEEHMAGLVSYLKRSRPAMTIGPADEPKPEAKEEAVTDELKPEADGPTEDTETKKPDTGSTTGENTGIVEPPMNRDDFFAACTATKVQGKTDTWVVTVPGGQELTIEGTGHHKQAKMAAYDKVYGETD